MKDESKSDPAPEAPTPDSNPSPKIGSGATNISVVPTREEWRGIPGHPGYEASSFGNIRSLDRIVNGQPCLGRVMKLKLSKSGYLHVALSLGIKKRRRYSGVHTLVCEAFYGLRSAGHETAHRDGVKTNNQSLNLRWSTPVENAADRERHGRTMRGSLHSNAKLTEEAVVEILRGRDSGRSIDDLAAQFSVSKWTIRDVLYGRGWTHVSRQFDNDAKIAA